MTRKRRRRKLSWANWGIVPTIASKDLMNPTKILSHGSRFHCLDSKWAPPEYMSEASKLERPCSVTKKRKEIYKTFSNTLRPQLFATLSTMCRFRGNLSLFIVLVLKGVFHRSDLIHWYECKKYTNSYRNVKQGLCVTTSIVFRCFTTRNRIHTTIILQNTELHCV
jgi:hypothetical protein